jgi:hypothetical protein
VSTCIPVEHILLPSTPELLSVPHFSQIRHVCVKDNGTTVGQYSTSLRFEKALIFFELLKKLTVFDLSRNASAFYGNSSLTAVYIRGRHIFLLNTQLKMRLDYLVVTVTRLLPGRFVVQFPAGEADFFVLQWSTQSPVRWVPAALFARVSVQDLRLMTQCNAKE